jgi:hypothetical protein
MIPDPSHARPLRWVLLTLVAIVVLGGYAHAQGFPSHYTIEADEFNLEVESDSYAFVEYYNSAARASGNGYPRTLTNGDLTVELRVTISNGPETLEVMPPEGWRAVPAFIDVLDGDTGVIELFRGEWHGM